MTTSNLGILLATAFACEGVDAPPEKLETYTHGLLEQHVDAQEVHTYTYEGGSPKQFMVYLQQISPNKLTKGYRNTVRRHGRLYKVIDFLPVRSKEMIPKACEKKGFSATFWENGYHRKITSERTWKFRTNFSPRSGQRFCPSFSKIRVRGLLRPKN